MAKKAKGKEDPEALALADLLAEMAKQSLPVGNISDRIEVVSSGIASFDHSTGVGGFPRRRMSLLQGKEAGGKTMLALNTIATVQRAGGRCAFVDAEHSLTPSFAELFGVNWEALVKSRPRTMNDAYDIGRGFWSCGLFDVVVLDALVSLATVEELESSASDDRSRAGLARLHSVELRKFNSSVHDRTAFIAINQLRVNPNPPRWWKAGEMLYSPGGRAVRHASSMTVDVKEAGAITRKGVRVGQKQVTYVVKNKVAPPYQRAEYELRYATGIDLVADLVGTGIRIGLIEKRGAWLQFDMLDDGRVTDSIREQGREAFEEAIRDDDEATQNLRDQVMSLAGDEEGDSSYDPREVVDEEDMD